MLWREKSGMVGGSYDWCRGQVGGPGNRRSSDRIHPASGKYHVQPKTSFQTAIATAAKALISASRASFRGPLGGRTERPTGKQGLKSLFDTHDT